jgi:hypothetical protein
MNEKPEENTIRTLIKNVHADNKDASNAILSKLMQDKIVDSIETKRAAVIGKVFNDKLSDA